ncbi:3'(2'),5'-bisphosphate nucleotidase CysQ [Trichothermofontia sichuanensis B231]|uniref:3'(2'),5'-bisphosphate nucleotidase CysQ family protein n=1 Tax=Trichothermofontia sichuanensis TaxID=3045816 RepID=UPI00224564EF|nr:3'(2'),5'-bisphosphate nucleotidase CysQ [Trichothermofontia sichuanensis B231]
MQTDPLVLNNQAQQMLHDLLPQVCQVGWGAAAILRSYYQGEPGRTNLGVQEEQEGPVTAADIAANHFILEQLHTIVPDREHGYLSEETYKAGAHPQPLPQAWVWIVDPLDGTRDFIDRTGEYALHIALTYQGRPVLAVVVCPELEKLYYATLGGGSYVQTLGQAEPDRRLTVSTRSQPEDLTIVVSRTHRDDRFNQFLDRFPCANRHYVGSVGCKISAIVEQQADWYPILSGKSAPKDWDLAAPELILTEAGGQVSRIDGSSLRYNQADVNQWGAILATNGHAHNTLCALARTIIDDLDQP